MVQSGSNQKRVRDQRSILQLIRTTSIHKTLFSQLKMKKIKLIIVENDKDEQDFMEEGFRESELFDLVTLVRNGDELFEFLESNTHQLPEIILSDLNMPGKNGYDILHTIRENPVYAHI